MRLKPVPLIAVVAVVVVFVGNMTAVAQQRKTASKPKRSAQSCSSQIESILRDPIFHRAFVGMKVVSLTSNKTLFERNAEKLFRPASNMKLFTTAAALSFLGRDFRFRTVLFCDSINGNTVKGSVYIKGFGDPLLAVPDLDSFATVLYTAGIRRIEGDVVGDVSYFDDVFWGKGWMWDDEPGHLWPYLTPLSLNGNIVTVTVSPGLAEWDPVSAAVDPPTNYLNVVNYAITSTDTAIRPLKVIRLWKERQNVITIEGAMHPSAGPRTSRFSVWKPELFTLTVLKERLIARGIQVHGEVRIQKVDGKKPFFSLWRTLDTVVTVVNKDSYNLGAESLLKTLAAELRGVPGSADSGIAVMKQYLDGLGIDTAGIVIADGSGVSRYNLVSPNAIITILKTFHKKHPTSETFLKSLPIAGIDGTLKTRLTNSLVRGNVRAKTGAHSDATALAGYAYTKNDTRVFAIIFNHFPSNFEQYRKAQDRIVEIILTCRK